MYTVSHDELEPAPLFPELITKLCRCCGGRFAAAPSSKATYCSNRCRTLARATNAGKGYKQGQYVSRSGRRESYDSSLEKSHMQALDAMGVTWTKAHGITIRYFDPKAQRERTYIPDFRLTHQGQVILQEMKPASLVLDETVQAKARAARRWCVAHGMEYVIVTQAGQIR